MLNTLIRFFLSPILPLCFAGGGGGDGGAKQQRRREEERQHRIDQAVRMIDGIFNNQDVATVTGKLAEPQGFGQAAYVDPGKTYYRADGSEWRAPTVKRYAGPYSEQWTGMPNPNGEGLAGQMDRAAMRELGYLPGSDEDYMVQEVDEGALTQALRQGLYTDRQVHKASGMNRQALYDQQKQAVTDINRQEVDKQYQRAERETRFGLARNGLLGGSEDVNVHAELQERQNKGLMQAVAAGERAASDLKMQDERARQSLISQAQSDMDIGSLQGSALRQLDSAAQSAQGDAKVATVSGLFNDMTQAYLRNQQMLGYQAGRFGGGQGTGPNNIRSTNDGTHIMR